jgi:hypothetical protein
MSPKSEQAPIEKRLATKNILIIYLLIFSIFLFAKSRVPVKVREQGKRSDVSDLLPLSSDFS